MKRILLALALLTGLIATPLAAYTVYLKDGTRIIAREKYRVEEGRAIIVLPNGTQTFIEASEIDATRTEQANLGSYGTALTLENGSLTETPSAAPDEGRQSLSDFIASGEREVRSRPQARRPVSTTAGGGSAPRTAAGYVDFVTLPRSPFRELEIASDILETFRARGVDQVQVFQGTSPDRPLLEITTNSEASVFRGLEAAAETLLAVRERNPGNVGAFEILMTTSDLERAGQFLLTGEDAAELTGDQVETAVFFIEQVQF